MLNWSIIEIKTQRSFVVITSVRTYYVVSFYTTKKFSKPIQKVLARKTAGLNSEQTSESSSRDSCSSNSKATKTNQNVAETFFTQPWIVFQHWRRQQQRRRRRQRRQRRRRRMMSTTTTTTRTHVFFFLYGTRARIRSEFSGFEPPLKSPNKGLKLTV